MVVEQVKWPSMSQINQGYHLSTGQPTVQPTIEAVHPPTIQPTTIVQQPPIHLGALHPPTIQPTTVQQPPTHLGAVHPPTLQHLRGGRGVS